ncbi:hypothetical protein EYB53_010795 [Candidatus Chloroploca sp. M-50]|uniref:Uncharacterized protein n=1 Tax=Candidatus Chloroploca mongolica TaxID=2528176 RepID=A0ABS4D9S3_9CHLR|nr:hypothetical protein [Candidatus Chloroploca mongolica]MBP1466193.1 hypothetical protein [Candidatus Chloroploca mongolica]
MIATLLLYTWNKTMRTRTRRQLEVEQQRAKLAQLHPPLDRPTAAPVTQKPLPDTPPDPIWFQLDRELQRLGQRDDLDRQQFQTMFDVLQECFERYSTVLTHAAQLSAQIASIKCTENERALLKQRYEANLTHLRTTLGEPLDRRLTAVREAHNALDNLRAEVQRTILTSVAEPLIKNLSELATGKAKAAIVTDARVLQQQLETADQAATDFAGLHRWQTTIEEAQFKFVALKVRQLKHAAGQLAAEAHELEPPLTLDQQLILTQVEAAEQSGPDLDKAFEAIGVAEKHLRKLQDDLLLSLTSGTCRPHQWSQQQWQEALQSMSPPDLTALAIAVQHTTDGEVREQLLATMRANYSGVLLKAADQFRTEYLASTFDQLMPVSDQDASLIQRIQQLRQTIEQIDFAVQPATSEPRQLHADLQRLHSGLQQLCAARLDAIDLAIQWLYDPAHLKFEQPMQPDKLAAVYQNQARARHALQHGQAEDATVSFVQTEQALNSAETVLQELHAEMLDQLETFVSIEMQDLYPDFTERPMEDLIEELRSKDPTLKHIRLQNPALNNFQVKDFFSEDRPFNISLEGIPGATALNVGPAKKREERSTSTPSTPSVRALPTTVPTWLITSGGEILTLKLVPQQRHGERRADFAERVRKRIALLDWAALGVALSFSVAIGLGVLWMPNPTFGAPQDWLLALLWGTTTQAGVTTLVGDPSTPES